MAVYKWIAEQDFRCVRPSGEVFDLTVRIGKPTQVAIENETSRHAYARCRIALEPLAKDRWGAGENAFQALCLSLDYVRTVFKVFLAEGGRIYWKDTDSHVDIASPWFAPMPSLASLAGEASEANLPSQISRKKK
jgi:hypothetical protein